MEDVDKTLAHIRSLLKPLVNLNHSPHRLSDI